jgi:hypothetical protein
LFALNYSDEKVNIRLDQPGYEMLSAKKLENSLQLGPKEIAIIQI